MPTSRNEVNKVKFRFNFIVSDNEESDDDGNSGTAHRTTVIAEKAQQTFLIPAITQSPAHEQSPLTCETVHNCGQNYPNVPCESS